MRLFKRKHTTLRAYIHDWLEPDEPDGVNFFSGFIVALVLVSLVTLALETEAIRDDSPLAAHLGITVAQLRSGLAGVNGVIVVIFAIEFILRFWSEGEDPQHKGVMGRVRFLSRTITIFDVLAFLPELIVLLFVPSLHGGWLAALRALRLFRLFKLARYVPAFAIVGGAFKRAGAPLMAALSVAAAQVYVAAMLLYFIEGESKPREFGSITRALWWSIVTLTTVGYGDVYPDTVLGRIAAALIAIAGIGIVAMPTGILASAFAEEFRERHEERKKQKADKKAARQ